jgi:hypothetical protein
MIELLEQIMGTLSTWHGRFTAINRTAKFASTRAMAGKLSSDAGRMRKDVAALVDRLVTSRDPLAERESDEALDHLDELFETIGRCSRALLHARDATRFADQRVRCGRAYSAAIKLQSAVAEIISDYCPDDAPTPIDDDAPVVCRQG